MGYVLSFSNTFQKHFKKLNVKEQGQLRKKLEFLIDNPSHPSLRVKRLQGSDGLYELSVNMSLRVIWQYGKGQRIVLVDVGRHDVLKKY